MTVFWTDRAVDHLLQIREHLGLTSSVYAEHAVDRFISQSEQLRTFPRSGRRVPEYERDDVREVQERPYRIVSTERMDVIAVVHDRRSLPSDVEAL